MTSKRVIILFCAMAAMVLVLFFRLFIIVTDPRFAAAASQSTVTGLAAVKRPDFYDCEGRKITGRETAYKAIAVPGNAASYNIMEYAEGWSQQDFAERMRGSAPFLVDVKEKLPSYCMVNCLSFQKRYADSRFSHLIGYLNGEGRGVSGLEAVFEDRLSSNCGEALISYSADATGRIISGTTVSIHDSGSVSFGIQLSIDSDVQAAANEAADRYIRKGAVVVIDCATGGIAALVSRPNFDQNNVEGFLDSDGALFNRTLADYCIGSVYKMVVQAAAAEAGIADGFEYDCTGSIAVDKTTYHCSGNTAHGRVNSEMALAMSCNCFHIALAQRTGAAAIRNMAARLGFGQRVVLYDDYAASGGYLPTVDELSDAGEFANHAFGQGRLLANPIQLAAYAAAIANGGLYRTPYLIKNIGSTGSFSAMSPIGESGRVMSEGTAALLQNNMRAVLNYGTAASAAPRSISAAGKTGTADSGEYITGFGQKVVSTFAGYFPAENPRYAVAVVTERETDSDSVAIRAFSYFADSIYPKAD